jgi:putative flavoprotein involved in K+ transport
LDADATHLYFNENIQKAFSDAERYLETAKSHIDHLIQSERLQVSENVPGLALDSVDLKKLTGIPQLDIERDNITNIIWSTGFRRDYAYIKRPIFDENGLPKLIDGISTEENIHFCGLELEVDRNIKSAFGVGLYAINESAKRAVEKI